MRFTRRNVAASAVIFLGVGKCAAITLHDDWSEIQYSLNKYLKRSTPLKGQKQKVVVLGTGWGALSCIQKLDKDMVDLTIISPRSFFFYTPLLAGMATGNVGYSSILGNT